MLKTELKEALPLIIKTIAGFGLGVGIIITLLSGGEIGPIESVLVSMWYTAIMATSTHLTAHQMKKKVPLVSSKSVYLHILSQGISTFLSFCLATAPVLAGALYLRIDVDLTGLGFIAVISFAASTIGGTFSYMGAFFREMRSATQAKLEAENRALRAQINPHFLFNSLNSIAALIRIRPAEAEAVTEDLADLFRYSLQASQNPVVTLAQELESVDIYLKIEKARFQNRMQVEIDVPPAVLNAKVPSLLLQPLVENAVKYGVGQTEGLCKIMIQAALTDNIITLSVVDDGPGFNLTDQTVVFKKGSGLKNVSDRLDLYFKLGQVENLPDNLLEIKSQGVFLHFPYQTE